jgi:hypothetical protein
MNLLKRFNNFIRRAFAPADYSDMETKRLHPKDVKPGDEIIIELFWVDPKICDVTCLNNDPLTQKMFVMVEFSDGKNQKSIIGYDEYSFTNFHLLNEKVDEKPEEETHDIASLQKSLNEALEKEEYEKAENLQKKIDSLSRK